MMFFNFLFNIFLLEISDGKIIFLFIQGGTVLSISPLPNPPRNDSRTFSLSYNSFSLPYTLNCFSVLKNDLMVVSDGVHTSVVNLIPPDQPDIRSTSLRGEIMSIWNLKPSSNTRELASTEMQYIFGRFTFYF